MTKLVLRPKPAGMFRQLEPRQNTYFGGCILLHLGPAVFLIRTVRESYGFRGRKKCLGVLV